MANKYRIGRQIANAWDRSFQAGRADARADFVGGGVVENSEIVRLAKDRLAAREDRCDLIADAYLAGYRAPVGTE